jgi:hypothetical protein
MRRSNELHAVIGDRNWLVADIGEPNRHAEYPDSPSRYKTPVVINELSHQRALRLALDSIGGRRMSRAEVRAARYVRRGLFLARAPPSSAYNGQQATDKSGSNKARPDKDKNDSAFNTGVDPDKAMRSLQSHAESHERAADNAKCSAGINEIIAQRRCRYS